jgi:hypothetical protein
MIFRELLVMERRLRWRIAISHSTENILRALMLVFGYEPPPPLVWQRQ